ncbi:MAG: response regulator transcription factor [Proteobacteria bacterium]|nr:response regulator transcription factor [Pseudomonadota bacterium]
MTTFDSSVLRVLLVEDSSLLAARLSELIRRLPDVDLIGSVDTELAALDRVHAELPDVLILDLHLRTGSGFGVLRALARDGAHRRPKVVILTNYGLPEYRREAEALGVEAFLDKSRDYFRLPALLRDFARTRSAGKPS